MSKFLDSIHKSLKFQQTLIDVLREEIIRLSIAGRVLADPVKMQAVLGQIEASNQALLIAVEKRSTGLAVMQGDEEDEDEEEDEPDHESPISESQIEPPVQSIAKTDPQPDQGKDASISLDSILDAVPADRKARIEARGQPVDPLSAGNEFLITKAPENDPLTAGGELLDREK